MHGFSGGRAALAVVAVLGLAAVAGCSGGASGSTPTWLPQSDLQTNVDPNPQLPNPGIPQPSLPGSGGTSAPSASPTPGGKPAADPAVLATKLNQPTGLVLLPDGSALVGERTTGKIFRVLPMAGQPVTLVQTLAGVDGAGDGGLLDLALSPTYDQDGLIYAYLTTATDNRVVHFALGSAPSAVIAGIPRGAKDNAGRIAFDATGALLTGTGDAGQPTLASSPTSLAGKILRTNDIGQPMADNPTPTSRIYASGFQTVDGLCVDATSGLRVAVSAGKPDEVDVLSAGADYGWPKPAATSVAPAKTLPTDLAGAGGCAIADSHLLIATSTSQSLAMATVANATSVSAFTASVAKKYGRLRSVVIAPDGAVWLTTRNRDGFGHPVTDDDRVIRITAPVSGSSVV